MRRISRGNRNGLQCALIAVMLLSLAALFLAGCGPTYWTNITGKRLAPSVASSIRSIVSDPTRDILYAATSGQGVWRCTAPGTNPTWTHMVGGAPLDYVTSVLYEPSHNVLYVAANSGVYSWADPASSASWKTTNGVGDNGPLAYDPAHDVLYAGTNAGVYRCTDPASSPAWADTGGGVDGSGIGSLLFDQPHQVLFAGTDTQGLGVWKYQGGTWTNTDKNFSASQSIGSAGPLAYDPTRDILYMSNEKEVLRCTRAENAPSWERMGGAVNSYTIGSVAYDQASNILYAGAYIPSAETEPFPINAERSSPAPRVNTHSTGVWACSNPDTSPIMTNTGGAVGSQNVDNLHFDSARRVLYAVSIQKAVWRYKPPANR